MKKILYIFCVLTMLFCFCSCKDDGSNKANEYESIKTNISKDYVPEFMELLDVRSFYDIEGKYLQVKCEDNLRPDYVKSILAKKSDEWFELDNGIYFGSRIMKTGGEVK